MRNMATLILLLQHLTMAERSDFNGSIDLKYNATINAGNMLERVEKILSNNSDNNECAAKLLPYFFISPDCKAFILNQYDTQHYSEEVKKGWNNATQILGIDYNGTSQTFRNARSICLKSAVKMLVAHCSIGMLEFIQYCLKKINGGERKTDETTASETSESVLDASVFEFEIVHDPSINVGDSVSVKIAEKDERIRGTIEKKNHDGTYTIKYGRTETVLNDKKVDNKNRWNVTKSRLRKEDGSAFDDGDRSVLHTLNFSGRLEKKIRSKKEFGKSSVNGGFQPIFDK